jgi:adenylate kinase family enzyme
MQRILVIGCGGAGKSTLAREMGPRLDLPVIHLDKEFWRAGWVEPEPAVWRAQVEALIAREAWVMDGNYSNTLSLRLARAQAVVWLDLPRHIYFPRVVWRIAKGYGRVRPDHPAGCPEQLDLNFLFKWVWTYPTRSRPKTLALLEAARDKVRVIALKTPREVRAFVDGLPVTLEPGCR